MTEKLEYSAADMASAAAGGWRDGQKAAAEAAQPAPAGEQPAPYGWVAAGQFFAAREDAVDAAEKTPCVEVYSRPQVLAILDRSAERQTLAEELARQLRQTCDELRALKSAPSGEREAFDKWFRAEQLIADHIDTTFLSEAFLPYKAFKAGAAQQRTQAERVPEGWRDGYRAAMNSAGWGVRELYVKHQHHDRVDGLLNRCKELEQSFIREADAMLAAAPAQPAVQDQGEVQRLREFMVRVSDHADYWGDHPYAEVVVGIVEEWREYQAKRSAEMLASSTGQEVE